MSHDGSAEEKKEKGGRMKKAHDQEMSARKE